MNTTAKVSLAILSGLLFSFAWPLNGFAPLLFVAFVPLLFIEREIADQQFQYSFIRVLGYSYISFFIWNALTTYWIYHATQFGAVVAVAVNALFMAFFFSLFHFTKKYLGKVPGYFGLIVYWISFEYMHMHWDLSWSWLNLGNGFSEYFKWVQWYEYTGIFGGAVWIFLINLLVYHLLHELIKGRKGMATQWKPAVMLLLFLAVPIWISHSIFKNYEEVNAPAKVVIVQPNIDPYFEKFDGMTARQQLQKLLTLAAQETDSTTDFVIGPETALVEGIWERKIKGTMSYQALMEFLQEYPNTSWVLGLSSYRMYLPGEQPSITARQHQHFPDRKFDAYNTAMYLDNEGEPEFYHKSKLVPGVEKMPFPALLKPFEKFALDLGGITGSLGVQAERKVFSKGEFPVGVAICYESIYGEYMAEYVENGAQLLFIITNDGWWFDTPGHRQHNSYARLRSIETRRSIARAANTGISCFINQKGEMFMQTEFWEEAALSASINANDRITFYARHGDYIARVALFIGALLLLFTISTKMNKTRQRLGK